MEELNTTKTFCADNNYIYPIIKGKNYYCVPTCLEMVIKSMGYEVSSAQIAELFSIITSAEAKTDNDIGVHLIDTSLDIVFLHFNIPLSEKYIAINTIEEDFFIDFIINELQKGSHILCGYSYGILFNDTKLINIGHFSIIVSANNDKIKMINPGPQNFGVNEVKDYELYRAIHKKSAGLWILKKHS